MMDISIIGAGRLGASLGYALRKKGHKIRALSCKSLPSAKESRKIIGEGQALTDNREAAKKGKVVFICVPDEEIERITKDLSRSDIDWTKRHVFHCSGLLPSEILIPLRKKRAWTASFHPVQSFPLKRASQNQFMGIYFGLEGCTESLSLGKKMVHQLGGQTIILEASSKPLYHAACSISSNFLVVLLDVATSLLDQMGLEKESFQILFPLLKTTLHNVKKFNIESSLTGPIMRGDRQSIEMHLEALSLFPQYHEIYTILAEQALEIAKKEGKLPPHKVKALMRLLEDR
jgi:predicted short-subunit dehydrogenase-like oxidoreductase (DUF2520 family)